MVTPSTSPTSPKIPKSTKSFSSADTVGMFQIESRAQMASLPRNCPDRFYDLVVQVAIIRPGPIVGKMMHPYMRRRQGREAVTYPHPSLEPVLKRTLGVPLFQEQLLRIAMTVANFTGAEAEELRRAVGMRRSWQRMKDLEVKLRAGMTTNGLPPKTQDEIVQAISSFALYGFPESHAASFALLAYASAYFKVQIPRRLHRRHPQQPAHGLLLARRISQRRAAPRPQSPPHRHPAIRLALHRRTRRSRVIRNKPGAPYLPGVGRCGNA